METELKTIKNHRYSLDNKNRLDNKKPNNERMLFNVKHVFHYFIKVSRHITG